MKLDIALNKGDDNKPAVVFIHGLGMDKNIWADPARSRILGGMFPLSILLNKRYSNETPENIRTLFHDLQSRGYPVITWSQKMPAGPMDFAVSELNEIAELAAGLTKKGVILIGHSRGGLIARKYLMTNTKDIRGLYTISTPHHGSAIAKIGEYLLPLGSMIAPLIPSGGKGLLAGAIKRIADFLRSGAFLELLPESDFFKTLNDGPLTGLSYASFGGTSPTLFNLYNLSFPDVFEKIIPANIYPEELKKGKGDGLVTAESSHLPWVHEHQDVHCNHAEILFKEGLRAGLAKIIETVT
jgi:pimeloyl-ACP methyl ester carboxylesterase